MRAKTKIGNLVVCTLLPTHHTDYFFTHTYGSWGQQDNHNNNTDPASFIFLCLSSHITTLLSHLHKSVYSTSFSHFSSFVCWREEIALELHDSSNHDTRYHATNITERSPTEPRTPPHYYHYYYDNNKHPHPTPTHKDLDHGKRVLLPSLHSLPPHRPNRLLGPHPPRPPPPGKAARHYPHNHGSSQHILFQMLPIERRTAAVGVYGYQGTDVLGLHRLNE
ncbi:hypothetical protein IG631_00344 [Alternaria alternata]|nr:hypothetical protein IG631_00344 [Alternaria alternata]